MRKWIVLLAASVLTLAAAAREQQVRDVTIDVTLTRAGDALVREKWNVNTGDEITEWYLPRENLGDIGILDFVVYSDGERLSDDGEWVVERSRMQKAGRYGIVHKRNGVELCWGVGEYGDHLYEVAYRMTNAVKTLDDYDMFHMQLVNDELAALPRHVRVTIRPEAGLGVQLDTTNSRAWGFGYEGTVTFQDGGVVFESSRAFGYRSSVIALLRFDKGIFQSPSVQDRSFDDVLERAMEGADFSDDDDKAALIAFLSMIATAVGFVGLAVWARRRERKKILGVKDKEIGWCRDVPFEGDLLASDYTLTRLGEDRKKNALAAAQILRMIYKGNLSVTKDARGRVEISFGSTPDASEDPVAAELWDMMYEASGSDRILQDKEFSAWSKRHSSRLIKWTGDITASGSRRLNAKQWMLGRKYTASGQQEARNLLGFRKFLNDFTLTGEREAFEVKLWREYLVLGALLGVAAQVAKQLKDIDPVLFEQALVYDYTTLNSVLRSTDVLSRAITNATTVSSSSAGGFGGHSSFGGGGGFSGGGHGGGGR